VEARTKSNPRRSWVHLSKAIRWVPLAIVQPSSNTLYQVGITFIEVRLSSLSQAREKRTFNTFETAQATSSNTQESAAKKARIAGKYFSDLWWETYLKCHVGPLYGRPMPLELNHGKENVNPQGTGNAINKGKQVVRGEGKSD
jgi:hypothetical protein